MNIILFRLLTISRRNQRVYVQIGVVRSKEWPRSKAQLDLSVIHNNLTCWCSFWGQTWYYWLQCRNLNSGFMLLQQETKFVHFIKPTQYYCLLGCDAVYLVEKYQDFRGTPPPPYPPVQILELANKMLIFISSKSKFNLLLAIAMHRLWRGVWTVWLWVHQAACLLGTEGTFLECRAAKVWSWLFT